MPLYITDKLHARTDLVISDYFNCRGKLFRSISSIFDSIRLLNNHRTTVFYNPFDITKRFQDNTIFFSITERDCLYITRKGCLVVSEMCEFATPGAKAPGKSEIFL